MVDQLRQDFGAACKCDTRKALDFPTLRFGTRGSEVQILSPDHGPQSAASVLWPHVDSTGALAQWVERGEVPDRMMASHFTNGVVDRTRPLCPYPQVAAYKGGGSTDDAAPFVCKAP